MTKGVTIGEAKAHFSKLVRRAEAGEEIVVRRGSEPVARIAPLERKRGGVTGRGSMKGEFTLPADEEWEQMDEEVEQLFKESKIFPGENSQPDRA